MPCVEFVECVNDYLEDALSPSDVARLETHLAVCPHCVRYLDQLRLVTDRAGKVTDDDIAPHVREDLLRAFDRWQQER